MFRLLGLLPGPDVSAAAAAALAGAHADQAQVWLDRLVSAHLVEERAPSRYTFHDLLRRYAADRVGLDDFAEREAAERRLSDWYLAGVDAAARVVYPQMARLPVPADLPEMRYEDDTAGMAWLEAERANLVAAVVRAADDGPRQYAWRLGDALRVRRDPRLGPRRPGRGARPRRRGARRSRDCRCARELAGRGKVQHALLQGGGGLHVQLSDQN